MKTKSELNCLVYDFYVTRILFGYYSYGDSLPPMQKISEYFRLAVPTVRTALKLLEKEGYIEISAPKAARVIYKASGRTISGISHAIGLPARKDSWICGR